MKYILSLFLILYCFAAKAADKVTFATGYIPNVQFTPFYVAAQKGYFAAEGIDVDFNYAMGAEPLKLVAQGKYEFGTADGDALLSAVSGGMPLVSIFSLYQKNPIAVYALEKSGIKTVHDLKAKRVGIPGLYGASFVGWKVAERNVTELQKAKLQVIGYTQVQALLEGKVDAALGYENNEPVVLSTRGHKVNVFPLREWGWLPGNGIVTSKAILEKKPKLARGFLKAVQKGLQDTLAQPEESFERVRKQFMPELTAPTQIKEQVAVLKQTLPLWKNEGGKLGEADLKKLDEAVTSLLAAKLLTKSVKAADVFSNEFLPQ